jgi:uncharacterized protein (TIGR00369 family)
MNASSLAAGSAAPLWQRVADSLARQGMMRHLDVRLLQVDKGLVTLCMPYGERVTQQQLGFHGGAIGALADIAAGYAALTMVEPDREVTTVEYKINFLAAFSGGELHATGRVIRAGRRVLVAAAEVTHHAADGGVAACAVMQSTLMPVDKTY